MPRFSADLPRRLFFGAMLLGSALITAASTAYFDLETLPPFAVEKLPVRFESLWLASLRMHVASALVSFPMCLALTTRWLRRRPSAHRRLGRLTGIFVLFALVPSGVVLAFDAKGGAIVTLGFLLSAAIVAGSTLAGVAAARRRDFAAHRRAMHHVLGQMSVAVTSRVMLVAFDAFGIEPDLAYVVALWAPVLASAAAAELVSGRLGPLSFHAVLTFERIRRDISPLALPVRVRSVVRSFPRLGR